MRPIIRWTLWQRRWSIFWWCLGISAFIGLELGVYSSIKGQAAQLNQSLQHLPNSVRSLFGANNDLFSPVGYLNSRLFYFLLPILLSNLTIGWGSSLIAREETDGTIELLLSRPVSRGRLLLSKILSGLLITLIITGLATMVTLALVKIVGLDVPLPRVAEAALMAGLLSLMFGALAFAVAAMGRAGRGAAIGLAVLVGLGSYIIASLETNVHWLLWPSRFLPYHYYSPTNILNGHMSWPTAIIYAAISVALFFLGWLAFRRRDIAT